MRNYLIAFFVLMAACAFGANVTFQSFNTNQFNANAAANSVSLNSAGTNIVDTTDLVLNQIYTNSSGSNLIAFVSIHETGSASSHAVAMFIDNNRDGAYESSMIISNANLGSDTDGELSGFIQPNGVYVVTNVLNTGNSIIAGTSQRVYSPIGGGVGPQGPAGVGGVATNNGVAFNLTNNNGTFAGIGNFGGTNIFTGTVSGVVTNLATGLTLSGPVSGGAPGITASFLDATGLSSVTNAVIGILASQPVVSNYLATTSDVTTNTIGGNFIGSILPTNGMAFYYNPTNGFISQGTLVAALLNKTWFPAPWANAWTNAVNTTTFITNTGIAGTNNYNMVSGGVVKEWSGSLLTPYWFNTASVFVQTYAPLTISPSVNLGGITTNFLVTDALGNTNGILYFTNGLLMKAANP